MQIKVDGGQYERTDYMGKALKPLNDFEKVSLFKVKKAPLTWQTRTRSIDTKSTFHDKLILISQSDEVQKVFIGSAGLTTNVQDNLNLENMLCITHPGVFNFFKDHFDSIRDKERNLEVETIE